MHWHTDEFKYRILSKWAVQDTFIYEFEGIIYRINWNWGEPYDEIFYNSDLIEYYNNSEDFVNRYHHEKLKIDVEDLCLGLMDDTIYSYLDVDKSGSKVIKKITHFDDNKRMRLFSELNGYPDLLNVVDYENVIRKFSSCQLLR